MHGSSLMIIASSCEASSISYLLRIDPFQCRYLRLPPGLHFLILRQAEYNHTILVSCFWWSPIFKSVLSHWNYGMSKSTLRFVWYGNKYNCTNHPPTTTTHWPTDWHTDQLTEQTHIKQTNKTIKVKKQNKNKRIFWWKGISMTLFLSKTVDKKHVIFVSLLPLKIYLLSWSILATEASLSARLKDTPDKT